MQTVANTTDRRNSFPTLVRPSEYTGEEPHGPDRGADPWAAGTERTRPLVQPAGPLPVRGGEPAPDITAENEKIIDFRQIAAHAGFVARAIACHKIIVIGVFVLALGATAAAVRLWPKTYHVSARLLAQRNELMAALSNPGRAIPPDADAPSRAAAETILRHDNLVALIKQTDLLNEWVRTRAPLLRAKDRLMRVVGSNPTDDERLDALVGLLEKRIAVAVGLEGTITIDIDWPDAWLGYQLVEAALQNFLETRQVAETSAIAESISILERSTTALQTEIDGTFVELQSAQDRHASAARPRGTLAAAPRTTPPLLTAPSLAVEDFTSRLPLETPSDQRLKAALDAKRQEIARLEDFRHQQLSELQGRLATALTIYTEGHPAVSSLRQSIASLSHDSPQLAALRSEAQSLEVQYSEAATRMRDEQQKIEDARRAAAQQAAMLIAKSSVRAPDPPARPASSGAIDLAGSIGAPGSEVPNPTATRLRLELAQLANMRERINSARIELATAQAGFKYRYIVTRPPQMPRRPAKPNVLAVLVAGALGAVLLAVSAAVCAQLLGNRTPAADEAERPVEPAVAAL
jgi:hypothetical protein